MSENEKEAPRSKERDKGRDAKTSPAMKRPDYRIPDGNSWSGLWKIFAGIGVLGLAGAGAGYSSDPGRFAFSYLFAFLLFLTLGLGAIFFILVERLTGAGWSITVRRTAEFFAGGIPVFILLFLPILGTMGILYPWLGEQHEDAGAEHAHAHANGQSSLDIVAPAYAQEHPAPAAAPSIPLHEPPAGTPHERTPSAHGAGRAHDEGPAAFSKEGMHGDPEHVLHEELIKGKAPWLNKSFFLIRALIYLMAWTFLATRLFGFSTRQDTTRDPKLTVAAQKFAPPAMVLFGLTLTFAAFDWIMGLDPAWFSTIFGVTIFAGSVVAIFATLIVVTMSLRESGLVKDAITVEHYHDMGKLLFGFLVFWAYVSFSQYMLIWYAALPEETTFYHARWDVGPWKTVSLLIVLAHFVVPFFILLSRNTKRRLPVLRLGAMWLLVMHTVEMYWLVMPNYAHGESSVSWIDAACFLGVGGIYLAAVFHRMTKHPLIPVGDPRLSRALSFENA